MYVKRTNTGSCKLFLEILKRKGEYLKLHLAGKCFQRDPKDDKRGVNDVVAKYGQTGN